MKGSESVVSIDHLKPAYFDEWTDAPTAPPTKPSSPVPSTSPFPPKATVTRSGHQVHWPKNTSHVHSLTDSLEGSDVAVT